MSGSITPLHFVQDEERTPLLGPSSACGPTSKILSETKVYPLIHLIRVDILTHIDTPLTHDQLLAPDSTYTIIRPLTEKYLALQNQATVFCLLLNKVQFVSDSSQLSINTLSLSRAALCEILAIRVLRGWSERSLPLATILLTPWAVFQGAPEEIIKRAEEEGDDDILTDGGNALEMAIVSSSKRFIRSPSCQKVIEGIWTGKIIYSGVNSHALIADNYKKKPIQMYNPHKAPLLDHYRLKVPKVRSFLEYTNFLILFILYVFAVEGIEEDRLNGRELAFIIYALAYSLDKLATIREHGLKVFSSSLVNGFDFVFMIIYFVYLGARTYGFHYHDDDALSLGADWLAIGAVLIFPRLAFVTLANNLMVLSIRSMLMEFFFLMSIGIFCFLGFLYALFTLGQGRFALSQIGWWLLEVYFGLDASGFENAHDLHPFLGPVLIIIYALLSNTLLLTVLVAILGNTFATINADAAAESMFRKAVSTLEGVKADAVFSYQLPFNIVAFIFMWPMSYILNPRWFHKLNVLLIRASNFPVLMALSLYERRQYSDTSLLEAFGDYAERYVGTLPRKIKTATGFDSFASRHDFDIVFEIEREIGTFYRGWDDDALDTGMQLPPAFDDDDDESSEEIDAEDAQEVLAHPKSAEQMTASPDRETSTANEEQDTMRRRRVSVPPGSSQASPVATSFPPRQPPASRPRRNSSIQEPSPLARLFVHANGDNAEIFDRLRERRMSLVGLAMPNSQSQPVPSSLVSPRSKPRSHSRNFSQGLQGLQPLSSLPPPPKKLQPSLLSQEPLSASKPDSQHTSKFKADDTIRAVPRSLLPPAEEVKRSAIASPTLTPMRTPTHSRPQSPAPTRSKRGGIPFPGREGSTISMSGSGTIGKASEVEARQSDITPTSQMRNEEVERDWKERLDSMEERQMRIEDMLKRLVGDA